MSSEKSGLEAGAFRGLRGIPAEPTRNHSEGSAHSEGFFYPHIEQNKDNTHC
jgi:hypothetical protein